MQKESSDSFSFAECIYSAHFCRRWSITATEVLSETWSGVRNSTTSYWHFVFCSLRRFDLALMNCKALRKEHQNLQTGLAQGLAILKRGSRASCQGADCQKFFGSGWQHSSVVHTWHYWSCQSYNVVTKLEEHGRLCDTYSSSLAAESTVLASWLYPKLSSLPRKWFGQRCYCCCTKAMEHK